MNQLVPAPLPVPDDQPGRLGAAPPFYVRVLPAFLFDETQPGWLYVIKGWLLTLLPSIMLGALVSSLVASSPGSLPAFDLPPWLLFTGIVLFAPVTETLAMVPPLLLLNRLIGPAGAVLGSAALWGGLHSLSAPAWGLVAWWPFFVFSAVILFWRGRGRIWHGMVLVTCIHAMQNAVPFALMTLT